MGIGRATLYGRRIMCEPILQGGFHTRIFRWEEEVQTRRGYPAHSADVADQPLVKTLEVLDHVSRVDRADGEQIRTHPMIWHAELYGIQADRDVL